jgi:hypothetical protein
LKAKACITQLKGLCELKLFFNHRNGSQEKWLPELAVYNFVV